MTPKPRRARQILKNTVSSYVRQVLQILTFVLLTPFIVRQVGAEDFGLWSLVQATIGLLGLMDLGYSASVVKFVADARGRGDNERLGRMTATFFWMYAGLGAATLLLTLALVPLLPGWMDLPADKTGTAQLVLLLAGLRAALGLPLGLFAGILTGYQEQILSNAARLFGTVSYALVAWWVLSVSPSLEALAWASLGTGVAANLLALAFCAGRTPGARLRPAFFRAGLLREIGGFSLWFFLIQISLLIATRVDAIIIGAFLPLTAVALYTVATRVAEKASALCRQLTNALTPVLAELNGAGDSRNIRAVFLKGSMLSTALAVPLLVGLFCLAEPLLVTWMGEEFRAAAPVCQVLLAAAFVSVLHGNAENVLAMTGDQRFLALSSIGGQVLNLVLTLALVKPFGIAGVAAATLTSQCVMQFGLNVRRAGSACGVGAGRFYREALWPSIPGAVACVTAVVALSHAYAPRSLLDVAVLLVAGGLCWLPVFWLAGLSPQERTYFLSRLRPGRAAEVMP